MQFSQYLILSVFVFVQIGSAQESLRVHSVHSQVPLGQWPQYAHVAASGDLDGDGDPDLVVGNGIGPNYLLRNDGRGSFESMPQNLPVDLGNCDEVVMFDVDGDADLDLFFANWGQQNRLFLNDGRGRFTDATATRLPIDAETAVAADAGDLDGDGDIDLVIANSTNPGFVYLNNGSGSFTAKPLPFATWARVASCQSLADVDGDGDLDLVVGSRSSNDGQDRLYLNDGTGRFTDVTSTQLPLIQGETSHIDFFDADGDGDQDLLVTMRAGFQLPLFVRLFLNNGMGTFSDVTAARIPGSFAGVTAILDLDGDGDLDVAVAGETLTLLINNGSGKFSSTPGTPVLPADYLVPLDAEGDGDTDLFIAGIGGLSRDLLLNDGQAVMRSANETGLPFDVGSTTYEVIQVDIDGDGDLDVIKAESQGTNAKTLFLNDGMGRLVDVTATALPPRRSGLSHVAVGDVDGDGDLDIVFAYGLFGVKSHELLLQTGPARFVDASARLPKSVDGWGHIALADFDGDLDLDLLTTSRTGSHKMHLNDGRGVFSTTISFSNLAVGWPTALAVGDIDGDGDLDAIVAHDESRIGNKQIYRNDGTGKMIADPGFQSLTSQTNDMVLADLDGDGDLDLFCANGRLGRKAEQDQLFRNDGSGTFTDVTATSVPKVTQVSWSIGAADFDLDGDLDLMVGAGWVNKDVADRAKLLINDGSGYFTDHASTWLPAGHRTARTVDVGDFDLDGDMDIVVANDVWSAGGRDGQTRIYVNSLRHLRVPRIARVGRVVDYVFTAKQRGALSGSAILCLSASTAGKIGIPGVGTLQLAPQALVVLPAVPFSRSGTASLSFRIPANPALINLTIYAQALVGHSSLGPYRLTNTVRHTLIN